MLLRYALCALRFAVLHIRRKPVESLKVEREKRSKATPPFDLAQGRESIDVAQDRELVERPVERQMTS